MAKDYYETLGVSKDSTKDQIKKAYKKLAKKYHPDLNKDKDASDKFKEINEAASVLGDESKRKNYDQFGTADAGNFGGGGFEGFDFGGGFDFDDLFSSLFGGGRRRQRSSAVRGSDLRFDLEITLEEAAEGVNKTVVIPRLETCSNCKGTGAKDGSSIKTCDQCNGQGVVQQTRRTPFGMFATTTTCPRCHGQGKMIKEYCPHCDGEGRIQKSRKLEVSIPAGADTGTRLRVVGEGEAGERGGPSGNLYIIIHVAEHKIFERDGTDLNIEVPLTITQVTLGCTVEVPTLKGKSKLKIPAATQTHTIFRMKGKGIPDINGYGKGDQMVKVIVQTPEKLTKKQKTLLNDLAKELDGKQKKKSFLERVFE